MEFARSNVLRRWYFASLLAVLAALLILRLTWLAPSQDNSDLAQSLGNISDNLIAACAVSLIVGLAYAYLYPTDTHSAEEIVRTFDIAETIQEECRHAREWAVRSRAANYFTTVTLKDLTTFAVAQARGVKIRILTIDPTNENLLRAYAKSMSDIESRIGTWSVERAKREVYASMVRAAVQIRRAPRVEITVGFSPNMWVMSLDLSDRAALVTCQNKGEDALLFRSSSPFFRPHCDDFDANWEAARRVALPALDHFENPPNGATRLDDAACEALGNFFVQMGLADPARDELYEIIELLDRKHDYA